MLHMQTATQKLATVLLGQDVDEWITERRAAGTSWRRIALELRDVTERQVDVDPQTLANWGDETVDEADTEPAEAKAATS